MHVKLALLDSKSNNQREKNETDNSRSTNCVPTDRLT